jgi:hypothetical protein
MQVMRGLLSLSLFHYAAEFDIYLNVMHQLLCTHFQMRLQGSQLKAREQSALYRLADG